MEDKKGLLVELKRWQVVLGGVFALGTPVATGYTSYIQMSADLKNERTYVKKDDLKELAEKIDKVSLGVAEIQGFIRGRDSRTERRRDR